MQGKKHLKKTVRSKKKISGKWTLAVKNIGVEKFLPLLLHALRHSLASTIPIMRIAVPPPSLTVKKTNNDECMV